MVFVQEAGHVVAALAGERPFVRVTIRPDHDSLGHVLYGRFAWRFRPDVDHSPRTTATIEGLVLIGLAGPAAERRFRGRRNWVGAGADIHRAAELGSYLYDGRTLDRFLDFMLARADDLVASRAHWIRIEATALALMERETLTADEVKEACQAGVEAAMMARASAF